MPDSSPPHGRRDRPATTPESQTPGRAADSGSRQLTHPNPGSQTGSPDLDRGATQPRPDAIPAKPARAK
jgi:hypothetical protein